MTCWIGLSNFKNIYPGSFSVATSIQNYLHIKYAHNFTQQPSKVCIQLLKVCGDTQSISMRNTQQRQENNEHSLHRTQIWAFSHHLSRGLPTLPVQVFISPSVFPRYLL